MPKKKYTDGLTKQQRYIKRHPHRVRASRLKWYYNTPGVHLMSRYKLTLEEYHAMEQKQGGKCSICKKRASLKGSSNQRLHIDHCHTSKKIRELLCGNCNRGLGYFKDDPK